METLKVATTQFPLIDNDYKGNMERTERMVKSVMTESNVDLLLFSELCIEGVDSGSFEELLTDEVREEIHLFWKRMAEMSGINILAGRVGKQNGQWKNLATCYSPEGSILAEYAKTHLYCGERTFFEAGEKRVVFHLKGFTIGIMICADLGFPELSRAMASRDKIDLFTVPSCWGYPHDMLWKLCNQMRAAENDCYLLSSNRIGLEKSGRMTVGNSMLTSPAGEILASLGLQDEGYFVYTIPKENGASTLPAVDWLEWLRPELY